MPGKSKVGSPLDYFAADGWFRLLCFQYKYPGTPMSTIAVPQNASVGRVMIVFSVQAVPIST
jgi:hypothetical protein